MAELEIVKKLKETLSKPILIGAIIGTTNGCIDGILGNYTPNSSGALSAGIISGTYMEKNIKLRLNSDVGELCSAFLTAGIVARGAYDFSNALTRHSIQYFS